MDDWSEWVDPAEWVMRLDVLLQENAELRGEVARLRADNARMAAVVGLPSGSGHAAWPPVSEDVPTVVVDGAGGELPQADASSATEVKIALFRALFAGRQDVYATRWVSTKSGRTGWSPVEDNPFARDKDEAERVFWPLTDPSKSRASAIRRR